MGQAGGPPGRINRRRSHAARSAGHRSTARRRRLTIDAVCRQAILGNRASALGSCMRVVGVVMAAMCVLAACGGPETVDATPTSEAVAITATPEATATTPESETAAATTTPEPTAVTSTPATTAAIPDLETAATPTPEPATVTPTPETTAATPESTRAAAPPAPAPTAVTSTPEAAAVTPEAQPPPTDESEFARVVRLMCERYADPAFRASLHVGQRILDAEFRELDELRQALGVDEQTFGIALVKRCSELHWEVASHLHLFSLRARALIDRRMFAVCASCCETPRWRSGWRTDQGMWWSPGRSRRNYMGCSARSTENIPGWSLAWRVSTFQMEHFCPELVQPIVAAGGTVGGSERMWRAREHAREACAAFEQALRRPESSREAAVCSRADHDAIGYFRDWCIGGHHPSDFAGQVPRHRSGGCRAGGPR